MTEEKLVYQACPSQITNLKTFVLAAFLIGVIIAIAVLTAEPLVYLLLVVPILFAGWKWLQTRNIKLSITTQRLIVSQGVFNRSTHETELYRVRDTAVSEPFWSRLFGLGTVQVFTTDEDAPTHTFDGYHKPHWIKDQIRNNAEICRRAMRWGNDNVIFNPLSP